MSLGIFHKPSKALKKAPTAATTTAGFGAFGEHYRSSFGPLAATANVWAPTFPGFGRSQKGALPYSQLLWTDFLRDFLEEVVRSPAVVAGNSIGGFMCSNLAADHPHLVKGLILLNSAGPITPSFDPASMPPRKPPPPAWAVRAFTAVLLAYLESNISPILKRVYPANPLRADPWLGEEIFRAACDPGAAAVFGSGAYLPPPRALNWLVTRFGGETLVLTGRLDPLNDAGGRAASLAALCSNATVQLLECGHCPHDELPTEFGEAVTGFVTRVNRAKKASAAGAR